MFAIKIKEKKMEIVEIIKKVVQELILPEFGTIKKENEEIKGLLQLTNQRLDNMNAHLIDQSRRIDETNKRIDETNKRIDETNMGLIARMDEMNRSLIARIDETNKRIDETNRWLIARMDGTNERIDQLYRVVVRREEQDKLEIRVMNMEREMVVIKEELLKLAA